MTRYRQVYILLYATGTTRECNKNYVYTTKKFFSRHKTECVDSEKNWKKKFISGPGWISNVVGLRRAIERARALHQRRTTTRGGRGNATVERRRRLAAASIESKW